MKEKKKIKTPAQRASEAFDEAQENLREFKEDNYELINEYRRLVEEYNIAVKQVVTAIKSQLKSSPDRRLQVGQFGAMKKQKSYWDGKALAGLVPGTVSDLFLKEQLSYKVDGDKLDQLIRQGEVSMDDIGEAFVEAAPTISLMAGCPKEMGLP